MFGEKAVGGDGFGEKAVREDGSVWEDGFV